MKFEKVLYASLLTILSSSALANSYDTRNVGGKTVHVQKTNTVNTTTTQARVNVGKAGSSNVFVHGTSHSRNMNTTVNPAERTRNTTSSQSVGLGVDF